MGRSNEAVLGPGGVDVVADDLTEVVNAEHTGAAARWIIDGRVHAVLLDEAVYAVVTRVIADHLAGIVDAVGVGAAAPVLKGSSSVV